MIGPGRMNPTRFSRSRPMRRTRAWPKPTSSIRMMRMLGALSRKSSGCARRLWIESCNLGAARLADGTGGNGSTEPSVGVALCALCASARSKGSWIRPKATTARTIVVNRELILVSTKACPIMFKPIFRPRRQRPALHSASDRSGRRARRRSEVRSKRARVDQVPILRRTARGPCCARD